MAKRNPFITTKTINGAEKKFDNANQGVLYPRFDIREGALMGTFNHLPTGKQLTMLAVPAERGYALVLHEGGEVYARGQLNRTGGKIAFDGLVGEDIRIVAFSGSNNYGRYLQIRPDNRDVAKVEENLDQQRAVLEQLDLGV